MAENTELIVEVARKLSDLHKVEVGHLSGLNEWTRAVKTTLCVLGKSKSYSVYANGVGIGVEGGEWLFDVCWLHYAKEGGWLSDVVLVAECEWGTDDEIDDDFQKLMVARADLRVIVFGDKNDCTEGTLKILVEELETFAKSNGGKGGASDLYLAAAYESNEHGFRFFKLTGRGTCNEFALSS